MSLEQFYRKESERSDLTDSTFGLALKIESARYKAYAAVTPSEISESFTEANALLAEVVALKGAHPEIDGQVLALTIIARGQQLMLDIQRRLSQARMLGAIGRCSSAEAELPFVRRQFEEFSRSVDSAIDILSTSGQDNFAADVRITRLRISVILYITLVYHYNWNVEEPSEWLNDAESAISLSSKTHDLERLTHAKLWRAEMLGCWDGSMRRGVSLMRCIRLRSRWS